LTINLSRSPEREANQLTRLWQDFGPNSYPLDIDRLITDAVNSKIPSETLKTQRKHFSSFEGSLVRTNNTGIWTILLNDNIENKRRQRFTYAHELGHFMCHRQLKDKFEDSQGSLNDFNDQLESEANTFASTLLMPANLFREEFEQKAWTSEILRQIGTRFECSLQASGLRYIKLSPKPCAFVVSRDGTIVWATKSKNAPYMTSYLFGSEMPTLPSATEIGEHPCLTTEPLPVGNLWSASQSCIESHYFDASVQGYQYTCVEFTG
jgi:hypothetical protein